MFTHSKGQQGFLEWKIDLSKAYDHLAWNFIEFVLPEIGIFGTLLKLIMQCITTVTYQANVNEELSTTIIPHCSLRQGDPLSQYISVLCLEKLSHQIRDRVHAKLWKPVKALRSGLPITHLFFADHLILFVEASPNQIHVIKECLATFCSMSGQHVNYDKSKIYCFQIPPSNGLGHCFYQRIRFSE